MEKIEKFTSALVERKGGAPLVTLDLDARQLRMQEQVQFDAGAATIKGESTELLRQVCCVCYEVCVVKCVGGGYVVCAFNSLLNIELKSQTCNPNHNDCTLLLYSTCSLLYLYLHRSVLSCAAFPSRATSLGSQPCTSAWKDTPPHPTSPSTVARACR